MISREEYEMREAKLLAPYALLASRSRGRKYPESDCPFRTCFQRDRDRIVHSQAFRRLEYKTQVFVNHEGDYYRTRLTHTLEVAQISRGIARTLRLNEDLAEAIALAHDLGHTPFGHRGEVVLNELMAQSGGFEHNQQSYRVVSLIEQRYPDFPGLNLSTEVLEGIVMHIGEYDAPNMEGIDLGKDAFASLEAQVVNVADEIAYMNHDLDDGLESRMIGFEDLEGIGLWKEVYEDALKNHSGMPPRITKYQAIRRLINSLVGDLREETMKRIEARGITSIDSLKRTTTPVVSFSAGMSERTKELKSFLFNNLYRHFRVERMADKATRILNDLFEAYLNNPKILPPSLEKAIRAEGNAPRRVCDYIAGMTDRFALNEHAKLFDPNERV